MRFFRWFFSWRGFRRVLIALAWTATILALVYGEENWRGRRAWQKFRHELEARGEQLDLKDFIPKPVPAEQNFAATPLVESWINDRAWKKFWEDNYSSASAKVVRDQPKVGRNEPCPCGSGKKYKKCHGA